MLWLAILGILIFSYTVIFLIVNLAISKKQYKRYDLSISLSLSILSYIIMIIIMTFGLVWLILYRIQGVVIVHICFLIASPSIAGFIVGLIVYFHRLEKYGYDVLKEEPIDYSEIWQ